MSGIITGLDRLELEGHPGLEGRRLGLLANQASLNRRLESARDVLSRLYPGQLKALFGPQHGFGGEDQDNMVETPHAHDAGLKIPVFSLYAESRVPSAAMFELIDTLVVDLQDVGTRVYTFSSTMLGCLRAAARYGKAVVVLDRPNPIGGDRVEGNLLEPELFSFVGPCSLPMRHGLTMGELALAFNQIFGLGCRIDVLSLKGWERTMLWNSTGLRWTMPSPNMPLPETAQVYPGQVIWEGTNISEGRGTCRPFEIFGAPFLDTGAVRRALDPDYLKGCYLQEYQFRPTFHKWAGELCCGFMIHVLDPEAYEPYYTSLGLLQAVMEIHPGQFAWKDPPYEYEYKKKPIDMIMGSSSLRRDLQSGKPPARLRDGWIPELHSYRKKRRTWLLYP